MDRVTIKTRPPAIRGPAALPRGPRWVQRLESIGRRQRLHGAGEPPPGFVRATTSGEEWIWWYVSCRKLAPDRDPREPPFEGVLGKFVYQSPEMGAYTRALGSAVVDFLYTIFEPPLAVRLQTSRFHTQAHALIQARDRKQRIELIGSPRIGDVVDVYAEDFMREGNPTEAAMRLLVEVLAGAEAQNPLTAGTAVQTRPPRR